MSFYSSSFHLCVLGANSNQPLNFFFIFIFIADIAETHAPSPPFPRTPLPDSGRALWLTHLMDPDWLGWGAQPAFAQRLNADDVVVLLSGEGQLGRRVGRGKRVYLLVPLPPVGQLRENRRHFVNMPTLPADSCEQSRRRRHSGGGVVMRLDSVTLTWYPVTSDSDSVATTGSQ